MHSRSHLFFAARKLCWSLSVEYSKSATPRHSSTAAVPRRSLRAEFKLAVSYSSISFIMSPMSRTRFTAQQVLGLAELCCGEFTTLVVALALRVQLVGMAHA